MISPDQHIIIHPGIVDHIEQGKVFVRILSQSACSSCHAKEICSISEVEEKIIEVTTENPGTYRPGDPVTVKLRQSLGHKAVMLGYVFPLIILVGSILTFVLLLNNEGLAALISILLLVPYYFAIYLFRNKLKKEFRFSIYSED